MCLVHAVVVTMHCTVLPIRVTRSFDIIIDVNCKYCLFVQGLGSRHGRQD